MKKTRIIAMILVLALILSMLPMTILAADTSWEDEYTVTISFEGLTLGQGFYIEPVTYTLSEINSLLGTSYTGNEDLMADQVTKALFTDLGIESQLQGEWGKDTFYIASVKFGQSLLDKPIVVPQVLVDHGATADDGRSDPDWLGEFDYNNMAGWMITVDNVMIDVSAGAHPVSDGSVIRWRFTLHGYGADQGVDTGWGSPAYFTAANKDQLYREYAKLERNGQLTESVKEAALRVMSHLDATQEEVDSAYNALVEAAEPEVTVPRDPQDVSAILNEALGQMRAT